MESFCPHCHEKYQFEESQKGQMIECPSCRNLFHVPESDEDLAKRYCPSCGYLINANSVICINCGHNFSTGASVNTEVETEQDQHPGWLKFIHLVAEFFPGLFRPVPLIAFILLALIAIVLALLCLFVLSLGAMMGGIGIGAASLIVYAQGVAILMSGSIETMKSAMVDFKGAKWDIFLLLAFAPMILLFLAMFALAKISS